MNRFLIVTFILATLAALVWRFPYALQHEGAVRYLAYLLAVLSIPLLTGRSLLKRYPAPKMLRDGALWVGAIMLLVLGYSFRGDVGRRLQGELLPQQVQVQADGSMELHASRGGHFFAEARVNGAYVRFVVDTGATDIVLSPADAERAGMDISELAYEHETSTANGYGRGASTTVGRLELGTISLHDVPVVVNKAPMSESLLGMSFLSRLRSFRVEDNTLLLIP